MPLVNGKSVVRDVGEEGNLYKECDVSLAIICLTNFENELYISLDLKWLILNFSLGRVLILTMVKLKV